MFKTIGNFAFSKREIIFMRKQGQVIDVWLKTRKDYVTVVFESEEEASSAFSAATLPEFNLNWPANWWTND